MFNQSKGRSINSFILLLFTLCISASAVSIISSDPPSSPQQIRNPSLQWFSSTNRTMNSTSSAPGSIYNIMTLPVIVSPSNAEITVINTLDIPVIIVWAEWNQTIQGNSSWNTVAVELSSTSVLPFNVTFTNGTIMSRYSVPDLTVDSHVMINIVMRDRVIDVSAKVWRPCYQLTFRDRDQMKLFMIQAELIGQRDWIYDSDGYQIGFDLTFHFTMPIQSFNFLAFSLLRYDIPTGNTNSFLPSAPSPPLLHLIPYWYSVTPRWNDQLQEGDQITVAGSFSVGSQSRYICWFLIGGQVGLPSDSVTTNNTGMFQCVVPVLPETFRDLIQSGDEMTISPGFLADWGRAPVMQRMTQVDSQSNKFTIILPSSSVPWWSFKSWPIYVIIGAILVLILLIYSLLLRYICRRRHMSSVDLLEVDNHIQSETRKIIETRCADVQPGHSVTQQSAPVQDAFDDLKPRASSPIDMKVLVKPSRYQWMQRSRRDDHRELLLR